MSCDGFIEGIKKKKRVAIAVYVKR